MWKNGNKRAYGYSGGAGCRCASNSEKGGYREFHVNCRADLSREVLVLKQKLLKLNECGGG